MAGSYYRPLRLGWYHLRDFGNMIRISRAPRHSLLSFGTEQVHGSMYRHLRTNLPREIMGFGDFPFTPAMLGPGRSEDARRYPSHIEVGTPPSEKSQALKDISCGL